MKLLIVSIIVLIAASMASAQISVSVSIQADIETILSDIQAQASNIAAALNTGIQTAATAYYKANVKARDILVAILNNLGSDGQTLAAKINTDFNNAGNFLLNQINSQLAAVQQIFNNIYVNAAAQVQKDIEKLKEAADANSAVIKCWEDNRASLQSLTKSAAQQFLSVVTAGADDLAVKNLKLVVQVGKAALRIEADIVTKCTFTLSPRLCTLKYVSISSVKS